MGKLEAIIAQYKAGELQFLCNCGVFLEGFDAPNTALVVMALPTKSLPLYVQMLGRGTRPWPGAVEGLPDALARRAAILASPKPHMTVLDFVGNAQQHARNATVNAADVLGGKYGEEVRRYAKQALQEDEKEPKGIDDALERADAELALLREEEERRRCLLARAEYRVRAVEDGDIGPEREHAHGSNRILATSKQIWKLGSLGVPRETARQFTKKQASVVINKLLKERGQ